MIPIVDKGEDEFEKFAKQAEKDNIAWHDKFEKRFGESRELFEWMKASVEKPLPNINLPLRINGQYYMGYMRDYADNSFFVNHNTYPNVHRNNIEWLKPIQSSLKEDKLFDFCHFLGKEGYKINGYDDGQLKVVIEKFLSQSSLSPKSIRDSDGWIKAVLEFHKAMEVDYHLEPFIPDNNRKALRKNILSEEIKELEYAMDDGYIIDIADAIVDSIYVLIGTAWEYGLGEKLSDLFEEVHRSNMSKLINGKAIKRPDGKVLKSANYSKPDLEKILSNKYIPKSASLKPNKISESDIEKMAEDHAIKQGLPKSDKEHFETTYWTQHNIAVTSFIAGCKAIINKQLK